MGPVPAAYSAEVFPLSHRELGASSAMAVTNLFAAALSLTFPWLLSALGNVSSFLLYAVLNIVAWVLVFLLVPETKKKSLDELDDVFSVPTEQFIRLHVKEVGPAWVKRLTSPGRDASLQMHAERLSMLLYCSTQQTEMSFFKSSKVQLSINLPTAIWSLRLRTTEVAYSGTTAG